MKRTITIALLAALLTATACGDSGATVTTTTPEAETTTEAETTPAGPIASYLPETDLSGFELRVATWSDDNGKYFWAEEANGEVVNDAVYEANSAVRDRFGAKITPVFYGASYNEVKDYVTRIVTAGEDAFDIVHGHDGGIWNMSLEGYFLNLRELEYQDFSQPWYPKNANDAYEVNGKQYVFTSYMSYQSLSWAKVIFMNKDIIEDYQLELPYDDIRNGSWTLDKLLSMSKSVYDDLDGDGKKSAGDKFGFLAYQKLYGFQAHSLNAIPRKATVRYLSATTRSALSTSSPGCASCSALTIPTPADLNPTRRYS